MAEPKPRQRKFAPRSRTGCLTCRTRRKRCDSRHPQCANCTRLNLACEWEPKRNIIRDSSESSSSPAPELQVTGPLRSSLDFWDILPGGLDQASERKHILQYYVEAYVPSISVAASPANYYTSLYMPWAFQIDGMLDVILAISSAQLSRRVVDPDRAKHLKAVSSRHENRCYAFIKERVSPSGQPLRDAYQVIAMILILVGLEALNGKTDTRWLSQLKCAQRLLNNISPEQSITDCVEVDSLHRHFTYHFAFASLMARVAPSPINSSLEQELAPISSGLMPMTTIDPLMGISYQLCDLIARIQYVTTSNPAFPHITEASFKAIETGIMSWTYENPFTLGVDLTIALDLIALAEAYRLAALIQLYRTSPVYASRIPDCASRTMEFVARIPPGSPAESSLLYPVFLAGAELDDEKAMAACSKRLDEIQGRNRYENVGMVQKVLKEVWRPRLESGKRIDWEDVLKEKNWSFTVG
ncbi:fungal-specific transcription factor domain-containing protein [Paraphoma chrysanthemicola]|uniref:Fungal-specific transcription factor domain-containing protein n=1 Tax=Paraphoma chrysanthemicola TaxID=798071 RepID=A0A8K0QXJ6_9PLEO|nr:fungal-specific transcription factor domain-containing protein [Paraphoma chrysanthemicola]